MHMVIGAGQAHRRDSRTLRPRGARPGQHLTTITAHASWRASMGPLEGLKVLEIAGLGPAPFAAMMLADMGALVLRIDRPVHGLVEDGEPRLGGVLSRGRRSLKLDLKS